MLYDSLVIDNNIAGRGSRRTQTRRKFATIFDRCVSVGFNAWELILISCDDGEVEFKESQID